MVALTAANLVASIARFVLLRSWVFRPGDSDRDAGDGPPRPARVEQIRRLVPVDRVRQVVRYGAVSVISTTVSLTVLGALVATSALAAGWATSAGLDAPARTVAVEAASIAAFGSLWVAQFVILDRVLFGRNRAAVLETA